MPEHKKSVMVDRDRMLEDMRFAAYRAAVDLIPECKETIDMLDTAADILGEAEAYEKQTLTRGLSDYQRSTIKSYLARMLLINHFKDYGS